MYKKTTYLLLSLAGILLPGIAASCPRITTGSTSCNSGIFKGSRVSASCSNNDVSVSGTVKASSFDPDEKVTLVPCILTNWVCFKEYSQDVGKICNILENTDGNECGTAGSYSIDESFSIPDKVQKSGAIMGAVVIKVMVGDEQACTQRATISSSNMTYGVTSLGIVAVVGVYLKRKRRRPLIILEEAKDGFVEMGDMPGAMA